MADGVTPEPTKPEPPKRAIRTVSGSCGMQHYKADSDEQAIALYCQHWGIERNPKEGPKPQFVVEKA